MTSETDDTVLLKGPREGQRSRLARFWPYAIGGTLLLAIAGGGTWWSLRAPPAPVAQAPAPSPAPVQQAFAPVAPPAPAPVAPAPVFAPPLVEETAILADAPAQLATYRFAPQPAVVVLQFPSLADQARMLNRIAALVEKQGYPRDRVLPHAELDAKIRASGMTPETFYYGHDYRADDIVRFFSIASELNPDEARLQDLAGKLGWHEGGALGALVTLVREVPGSDLDAAARATILRHELSHGVYFTSPLYADYCHRFWSDVLTAKERASFTSFLQREGYDPALSDLIINETQAYLVHTRDRRFFLPSEAGLTDGRAEELRRIFVAGMPPGWLRDVSSPAAAVGPVPLRAP